MALHSTHRCWLTSRRTLLCLDTASHQANVVATTSVSPALASSLGYPSTSRSYCCILPHCTPFWVGIIPHHTAACHRFARRHCLLTHHTSPLLGTTSHIAVSWHCDTPGCYLALPRVSLLQAITLNLAAAWYYIALHYYLAPHCTLQLRVTVSHLATACHHIAPCNCLALHRTFAASSHHIASGCCLPTI
jgi:hypothetical protein